MYKFPRCGQATYQAGITPVFCGTNDVFGVQRSQLKEATLRSRQYGSWYSIRPVGGLPMDKLCTRMYITLAKHETTTQSDLHA